MGEAVAETLAPIRTEHARLMADKAYLEQVMRQSAERAARLAARTMGKVRRKVGLAPLP